MEKVLLFFPNIEIFHLLISIDFYIRELFLKQSNCSFVKIYNLKNIKFYMFLRIIFLYFFSMSTIYFKNYYFFYHSV